MLARSESCISESTGEETRDYSSSQISEQVSFEIHLLVPGRSHSFPDFNQPWIRLSPYDAHTIRKSVRDCQFTFPLLPNLSHSVDLEKRNY